MDSVCFFEQVHGKSRNEDTNSSAIALPRCSDSIRQRADIQGDAERKSRLNCSIAEEVLREKASGHGHLQELGTSTAKRRQHADSPLADTRSSWRPRDEPRKRCSSAMQRPAAWSSGIKCTASLRMRVLFLQRP